MALCFALLTSGVVAYINGHSPFADSFYDPPDNVPAAPGQLIRSEPFTRDVPEGAVAWRILYTTTRNDGVPAVASGIVVVPDQAGTEPLPVIAWAHGTTGFDESCAPSVLRHPFESGALPAFDQLLERGWALVATDYIGLGTEGPHPYLIGQGEGRSVLDAIRAARQLDAINLSDEAVVWGHSQGGHAALWTGQLAATYAPDAGVIGVAAMAPAADILGLVDWLPDVLGGSVFSSFVAAAYIEHYPDVSWEEHIIPSARTLVREMSGRCLSEPGVLASVLTALSIERDREIFRGNPATGALGARFVENIPTGPIDVPVMIAQGGSDTLVAASVQDGYAAERCRDGWNLVYRVYDEQDHLSVVADSSPLIPDLIAWTMDRFEGKEQLPDCSPAVASVSSIR
jgi:pimeloyl-ACP methyl ester carboxylesterase